MFASIKMAFMRLLTLSIFVVPLTLIWLYENDSHMRAFWTVFTLRYGRFIGHFIAYWAYQPAPVSLDPAYSREDVTVILPTVEPTGPDFLPCVESIVRNRPHTLLVVTVGPQLISECEQVLQTVARENGTKILVSAISRPSKRRQVAHAMPQVETPITILADDHVFWPSLEFLPSVMAPFEDPKVGIVATNKLVLRTTPGEWSWNSCVNFIACNYLQRHNWELRATTAIDGGLFVVSGRTAAYRTDFIKDTDLLARYCHESFFFNLFGRQQGLGPDDDNFLTRVALKKGWKLFFQDTPDATIETTLGQWPKFQGQLIRWARTTFRSNPVMLRDPVFLYRYTWSFFMVYGAGLVNFALAWDLALTIILCLAPSVSNFYLCLLWCWILSTKAVKIIPNIARHPADVSLVVVQFAFAYVHSLIKFWALLTFWDCDWSGRKLDQIATDDVARGTEFRPILPSIPEHSE